MTRIPMISGYPRNANNGSAIMTTGFLSACLRYRRAPDVTKTSIIRPRAGALDRFVQLCFPLQKFPVGLRNPDMNRRSKSSKERFIVTDRRED